MGQVMLHWWAKEPEGAEMELQGFGWHLSLGREAGDTHYLRIRRRMDNHTHQVGVITFLEPFRL